VVCCAGSPVACDVIDPKCLRVNWDAMRLRRVGEVVQVEVSTDGSAIDDQISCSVTGKCCVLQTNLHVPTQPCISLCSSVVSLRV